MNNRYTSIIIIAGVTVAVLLFCLFFQSRYMEFTIEGYSMEPTIKNGDKVYCIVPLFNETYQEDDVVLFKEPFEDKIDIKRIFAANSSIVLIKDRKIYKNDLLIYTENTDFIKDSLYETSPDVFFMLGDGINQSTDSRNYGLVNKENILCKAIRIKPTPSELVSYILGLESYPSDFLPCKKICSLRQSPLSH